MPDISVLRNFKPYGNDSTVRRDPGIYLDVIERVANALEGQSSCLSYDGKKIKQGLTPENGDVDLLGHEKGETLAQSKQRLKDEVQLFQNVMQQLNHDDDKTDVNSLDDEIRQSLVDVLHESLKILGKYAQKARELKEKKEFARKKLLERCGQDWRQSQFSYAVSAMNAFLYDISSFSQDYEKMLEKICSSLSTLLLSESLYWSGKPVHLETCRNFNELIESDTNNPRFVKQQTEKWKSLRQTAKVTGSTLYSALGLETLRKQQQHFEKVVCGIPEPMPSKEVQSYMDHGTENEPNAVATLVSKVLPVLLPRCEYFEEGCFCIEFDDKPFMVVSPDGSIKKKTEDNEMTEVYGIEIKCPVRKIHNALPERYVLQCLAEMEVLNVDKLLYLCWRPDITSVFEVQHNKSLLQFALREAIDLYGNDKPRRPSKLSDNVADLRKQIKEESQRVRFLGEFPSVMRVNNIEKTTQDSVTVITFSRVWQYSGKNLY